MKSRLKVSILMLICLLAACTPAKKEAIKDIVEKAVVAYIESKVKQIESKEPIEIKEEVRLPAVLPTPTPVPTPIVEIPEKKEKDCGHECCFTESPNKNIHQSWGDGRGGFLWKPHSETRPGVVFLIPGSYGRAEEVRICGSKNCVNMEEAGGANPEANGDCRHHWRHPWSSKKLKTFVGSDRYLIIDRKFEIELRRINKRLD